MDIDLDVAVCEHHILSDGEIDTSPTVDLINDIWCFSFDKDGNCIDGEFEVYDLSDGVYTGPCPFCGGFGDCTDTVLCDRDGGDLYTVECKQCGVLTRGHKTREEALEVWNKRLEIKLQRV